MPAKKNISHNNDFEKNLERLEDIVSKMEDSECSFDEAFSMFEEGVSISKKCSKILDGYERKIFLIKKNKSTENDSEHYLEIFDNE